MDTNYEDLIENLLLQQILLYTQERTERPSRYSTRRSIGNTTNTLLVRQQTSMDDESHRKIDVSSDDEQESGPMLCLVEASEEKPSQLIEDILRSYNQRHNQVDHNLIDLVVERNRARRHRSICPNSVFHLRLQWLAIGLVIDRWFFYLYFTATLVSYIVTLWLIPYSHPNLIIDINNL